MRLDSFCKEVLLSVFPGHVFIKQAYNPINLQRPLENNKDSSVHSASIL